MTLPMSGLPGADRTLDLADVLAAYDDPAVEWAITLSGHLHHLTKSGSVTLCGHQARPSPEPAWPHAVCRKCLEARVAVPPEPPSRPKRPRRRYAPPVERRLQWDDITARLDQCTRLYGMYWGRWLDAEGDLVWLKGTERPNVDPVARADARTSCADMNDLWGYVWSTEVLGGAP